MAAALLALHALAAAVWVGGMFFAYLALRPAAGVLEPPARLALFGRVFGYFFPWVWAAVVALLASGYGLIFGVYGGMGAAGLHVHIMQGVGILMMLLFLHLYFAPYRSLRRAVAAENWPAAGRSLGQIRLIVAINLVLGLVVIAVGSSGRYWA